MVSKQADGDFKGEKASVQNRRDFGIHVSSLCLPSSPQVWESSSDFAV